jgi:quercetin dioxygenase-like cupin family protein
MKRASVLLALIVAVATTGGIIGIKVLNAQDQPVKRTVLQKTDLEGVEGMEVVLFQAEIAPGAESGKHFHPGPEYFYILEGSMIVEPEGHERVTLTKGQTGHNPAKHVHNVKNASTNEPAKALGFLIAEKGQPLATPVK